MTTAHRPTFHNALGGENQGGNLLSAPTTKKMARDIPQELTMKTRHQKEKTRAELLQEVEERELLNTEGGGSSAASTSSKMKLGTQQGAGGSSAASIGSRRPNSSLFGGTASADFGSSKSVIPDNDNFRQLPVVEGENPFPEDADAEFAPQSDDESGIGRKKSKDNANSDDDDEDSDSDSDYEALQLELAKIRQEKEDARLKAEAEAEREKEQDRKAGIGEANPLLNKNQSLKRAWNEDSIFKNQSRTAPKQQRRFINDNVRSDFHKRFLNKYMAM